MECWNCKSPLPEGTGSCPYCGADNTRNQAPAGNGQQVNVGNPAQNAPNPAPTGAYQGQYAQNAYYAENQQNGQAAVIREPAPQKPKKERKAFPWIIPVGIVAVLLLGLNVFQFLHNRTEAENYTNKNNELTVNYSKLKGDYETLRDDYDLLNDDYLAVKADYDSISQDKGTLDGEVDDLKLQLEDLQNDYDELSDLAERMLEHNSAYMTILDTLKEFDYHNAYSDIFADETIVVLAIGETRDIHLTSHIYGGHTKNTDNNNASVAWGEFENDVAPLTITGKAAGVTNLRITNDENDHDVNVLIIVLPV